MINKRSKPILELYLKWQIRVAWTRVVETKEVKKKKNGEGGVYSEASANRIYYNQPLIDVQCEKIGDKDQLNASGPSL